MDSSCTVHGHDTNYVVATRQLACGLEILTCGLKILNHGHTILNNNHHLTSAAL